MNKPTTALEWIFLSLTIIGGLNWGLIGFFDFNLVNELFSSTDFQRVIYAIVGVATIGLLVSVLAKNDHYEA